MKIRFSSIFVDDQEKALRFYTDVLGFVKKADVSQGEYRWLTVVAPDELEGTELVLEPNTNPLVYQETAAFQQALYDAGIPFTMFVVDDIEAEYQRLRNREVTFRSAPTEAGPVKIAVLDDTCGNLIQIVQPHMSE